MERIPARNLLFRATTPERWRIALGVLIATLAFGQIAIVQSARSYPLGLTAQWVDEQLVITETTAFTPGWYGGVRPGDRVQSIDKMLVSPFDSFELLDSAKEIETRSPTGTLRRVPSSGTVPCDPVMQGLSLLLAFAFVSAGVLTFIVSRLPGPGAAALILCSGCALILEGNIARVSGAPWTQSFTIVGTVLLAGVLVISFMMFPVDRTAGPWGGMAARTVAGLHVAIASWFLAATTADPGSFATVLAVLPIVVLFDLVGSIILVIADLIQGGGPRVIPERLYPIISIGAVVSFGPVMVLSLIPHILGGEFIVPPYITYLSAVAMPLGMGIGVIRRHLVGVRGFLSRGLIALAVWGALLGLASLSVGALIADDLPQDYRQFGFFAAASILLAFASTEGWVRRRLERALVPDYYDYSHVLQSLSDALVHVSRPEAVASHVLPSLGTALNLTHARLILEGAEGLRSFEWSATEPSRTTLVSDSPDFEGVYDLPLVVDSSEVGRLFLGPKQGEPDLLPLDLALISAVHPIVTTAVQNSRLVEQLEQQIALAREHESELADLSARLLRAHEEEGARIAVEIHDDPLQRALFLARQFESNGPTLRPEMLRQEVLDIIASLRAVCAGLQPPTLAEFGLVAGLEWLLAEMRSRTDIAGTLNVTTVGTEPTDRLEPDLELSLFRIAQESLNNGVKHSGCTQVNINLHQENDRIALRIEDDGVGIDTREVERPNPDHLGISGMRQRLTPWGGTVEVQPRKQGGTVVSASVPRDRQAWLVRPRSQPAGNSSATQPVSLTVGPDPAP